MHYTITQKSLEQLNKQGIKASYIELPSDKGYFQLAVKGNGRGYNEAFENFIDSFERTLSGIRAGKLEDKEIGICELESLTIRNGKNKGNVGIIGLVFIV